MPQATPIIVTRYRAGKSLPTLPGCAPGTIIVVMPHGVFVPIAPSEIAAWAPLVIDPLPQSGGF
jgi:hypothetical protein